MSSVLATVILPHRIRAQLAAEAQAAAPCECCGLVEGTRAENRFHVTALYPAHNLAKASDRFEIDPAAQFALARRLRGTGREIIGCYHSHPHGRADPSARDMEGAGEENFVWLIAADTLGAYLWTGKDFGPLAIAEPEPQAL